MEDLRGGYITFFEPVDAQTVFDELVNAAKNEGYGTSASSQDSTFEFYGDDKVVADSYEFDGKLTVCSNAVPVMRMRIQEDGEEDGISEFPFLTDSDFYDDLEYIVEHAYGKLDGAPDAYGIQEMPS